MVRIYVDSVALDALLDAAEYDNRLRGKVSAVRASVRSLPEPEIEEEITNDIETDDYALPLPFDLGEPYPPHEDFFKTTI